MHGRFIHAYLDFSSLHKINAKDKANIFNLSNIFAKHDNISRKKNISSLLRFNFCAIKI